MRIKNFKQKIRSFGQKIRSLRQKMKYGYSDSDVWNIDLWFVRTITPMLQEILDHHYTYPTRMSHEEYKDKLKTMIRYLHYMDEHNASEFLMSQSDENKYPNLEDLGKFMEENKNKFFELFSELFYDLWD